MVTKYFNGFCVVFDDLKVELIDSVEHSLFYKCKGYDDLGRQYEGISEFTCGDLEEITDIERISNMHHNRKPYQARKLLKSINYWKSILCGKNVSKRPFAYYRNKLSYYTEEDIRYLKSII